MLREKLRKGNCLISARLKDKILMWQILNRMAIFPRWPDLKHFNSVTTTHFTDGQSFYDILKVRLMLWQTRFKANEFMVLVHFAVHCGLSSKKLRPGALYTCLPPFQNTCWSAMYDRKSARASSACLASLPKILHRLFTEYLPYFCKTNAWNFFRTLGENMARISIF